MTGARERRHQHVESRETCPPAEVEILVAGVQPLVEQTRPLPCVPRDQHGARRDAQDLDHPVELPLIDLSRLQWCVRMAEPVGGPADVSEEPRLVPVDDLGTHHPDVLDPHADRRLDEARHGVGVESGVVVQHQEVVRLASGGDLERGAHRSREAAILFGRDDPSFAERLGEELSRTIARRVVDCDDPHPRVRLRAESRQASAEPSGGVPDHQDDQYRGRELRRGFGGRCSHAMRSRAARSLAGPDP